MKRFSAIYSEELKQAIVQALNDHDITHYPMTCVGDDEVAVRKAVDQGIDGHLEACYVPDRGDYYGYKQPGRLECRISKESLPVLVRRLLEAEDNGEGANLASGICQTLDIELV